MNRTTLLVLALVFTSPMVFGQATTATVSGLVTDSGGAIIPGATITITNEGTAVTHDAVTNTAGEYTIPLLPPGSYSISGSAPNMRREIRPGVTLQIGQEARMDFQLAVGEATQTITVEAAAGMVHTEDATLASVVQNKTLEEVPLNGRVFWNLVLMEPAVNLSVGSNNARGGMIISGQPETSNNWIVDGGNDVDWSTGEPAYRPSVDAIQEFKIYTGNYEAQFGRNAGGQIVVVTKSGTNAFHGTLFEFLRNQDLDAKNFFAGATKPAYKRNQFGGTVGGPIRKNKTFFFLGYEGLRLINQQVALSTVPTAAELNGDFSALPNKLKVPAGYAAGAIVNNVINSTALTAPQYQSYVIGRALLGYYPAPTYPTLAGLAPLNNYVFNENATENSNQGNVRVDHALTEHDSLFASINYINDYQLSYYTVDPICGTVTVPGFGCSAGIQAGLYGLNWIHTFSPSVVSEFHGNFERYLTPRKESPEYSSINFEGTYGIPADTYSNPANNGPPNTNITGYSGFGYGSTVPNNRFENAFDFSYSVFWTAGKHSFKAGAESIRVQNNAYVPNYAKGVVNFTNTNSGPTTGYALADALLGLPATTSQSSTLPQSEWRTTMISGYIQDAYKVTRTLTVNYGLRWEETTPVSDNYPTLANFNTVTGTPFLIGTPGHPSSYNPYYLGFGPRLGIAYQLFGSQKTVLRMGGGRFYNAPAGSNSFLSIYYGYPVRTASSFVSTATNPLSFPDPFIGTAALSPAGIEPNYKVGMVDSWSADIQREITSSLLLDVGYFGSRSTHIQTSLNVNQPLPSTLPATAVQATMPYPGYSNITYLESEGISTYDSLQIKLDKRVAKDGLLFSLSYTFAKSLDDVSGSVQNDYNLLGNYGRSAFDVRSRLVFSPVYALPFGSGRAFLNNGNVMSKIVGGFQLSGIVTVQSGVPITAYMSGNFSNANILAGADRPNVLANPNTGPQTLQHWFNTTAFVAPATGTFGNEGTNLISGPGLVSVDLSLAREFLLPREAARLQLRLEGFNIANHPNFAPPNGTVNSPQFGVISSTNTNTTVTPRQIQIGLKAIF